MTAHAHLVPKRVLVAPSVSLTSVTVVGIGPTSRGQ